jgi:antitoxin component HigA of HigAB toxin-antitoxin module
VGVTDGLTDLACFFLKHSRYLKMSRSLSLINAAKNNNVNILLRRFGGRRGFTIADARANDNLALRLAAANGHARVLRILHDVYRLNTADARANDNNALQLAARQGHVGVLQILHERYGLTTDDARANDNNALQLAAENGHSRVLQILHERYGLTTADARANENNALQSAAANGHVGVLQILHERYGLTTADARANENLALRLAAANGHVGVLQILHDRYGLTTADARANGNSALQLAASGGHADVLQILRDVYKLTHDDDRWRRLIEKQITNPVPADRQPIVNCADELSEMMLRFNLGVFGEFMRANRQCIDWANDRLTLDCAAYSDVIELDDYHGPIPVAEKPDLIAFIHGGPDLLDRLDRHESPQVLCLHRQQLLRYWLEKLDSFQGKLARNFDEFMQHDDDSVDTIRTLINNLGPILHADTNVFILLPTQMQWFDTNPQQVGAEHNWGPRSKRDPTRYGDAVFIVLPLNRKGRGASS